MYVLGTSPGQTVPVPVVSRRLHLQAIPGDTHAHAHRRAALSVRHLPQALHAEVQPQHPQADALRYVRRDARAGGAAGRARNSSSAYSAGPALPVPAVPGRLHVQAVPGDPQPHAHRRAALPVRRVPQEIRAKVHSKHTQTNAHRSVSRRAAPPHIFHLHL